MRILVTGAAGFIGFHTCKTLLERGDDVIGLDNLNSFYDVTLKQARLAQLAPQTSFRFVKADLEDRALIEKLFAEHHPQRVIHLAAQAGVRHSLSHPHDYVSSNLVGFLHVLEGCRHNGVEHLVYASSSSVYGANTAMPFSRAPACGPSGQPLWRDKKSQRIDGACLRSPVWAAGHGVALLHRLRALGPARHVDLPVHPKDSRRRADRGLQSGQPFARFHLHRRHRPGRGPILRPSRDPRPRLERGASRPGYIVCALSALQHRKPFTC